MKRRLTLCFLAALALAFGGCEATNVDLEGTVSQGTNPTALHTASGSGMGSGRAYAENGGCKASHGTRNIRKCKWYFRYRLTDAGSGVITEPAGAHTNAANAAGPVTAPSGPFEKVYGASIELQPWTNYEVQACAWINWSDTADGVYDGPYCGAYDGIDSDNQVDLNTWRGASMPHDPSGYHWRRWPFDPYKGMVMHWFSSANNTRVINVGDCVTNSTIWPLSVKGEVADWQISGKLSVGLMLPQNSQCDDGSTANWTTQEVKLYNQNLGDNGIYGQAENFVDQTTGQIIYNWEDVPNPAMLLNDYYGNLFAENYDKEVVRHEMGHILGLAHRAGTEMNAVNLGNNTNPSTVSFNALSALYNHADSVCGLSNCNSQDSTAPAPPVAAAAAAAVKGKKIKSKKVVRTGDKETATFYAYEGSRIGREVRTYHANASDAAEAVKKQDVPVVVN